MSQSQNATNGADPLQLLGQVLALGVKVRASDIHLRTRNHPILRVDGSLRAVREVPPLPPDFMERLARTMMSARHLAEFETEHQVDLSIGFKDIGRVRANIFYQRGSIGMVLRVINTNIPSPSDLKLPDLVTRLASGLVYHLQALDDDGKQAAIKQRAHNRGLDIPDDVIRYVLNRYPRDMHGLFDLLDRLDKASLAEQRRLTIPFIQSQEAKG